MRESVSNLFPPRDRFFNFFFSPFLRSTFSSSLLSFFTSSSHSRRTVTERVADSVVHARGTPTIFARGISTIGRIRYFRILRNYERRTRSYIRCRSVIARGDYLFAQSILRHDRVYVITASPITLSRDINDSRRETNVLFSIGKLHL